MENKTLLRMQRIHFRTVEHAVTVRRIKDGWNCRVFTDGTLNQEVRVFRRDDIGPACRAMLRAEDKAGNHSAYASAARHRAGKKANV